MALLNCMACGGAYSTDGRNLFVGPNFDFTVSSAPEPATWVILTPVAVMCWVARRKRNSGPKLH